MRVHEVGREVERLRGLRGMKQIDVAIEAEVAQSQVSMLERGLANPTIETLRRIVGALGYRLEINFVSNQICQVHSRNTDQLTCPYREAIYRCERTDPHGREAQHYISAHTREHAQAGNGYACESVDAMLGAYPDRDRQSYWMEHD